MLVVTLIMEKSTAVIYQQQQKNPLPTKLKQNTKTGCSTVLTTACGPALEPN